MRSLVCIAAVALLVATSAALKVDSIAWTTPLNDNNESATPVQWIAASSSGTVVVLDGTNLTLLNPHTGAILWTLYHNELDASTAVFAASSTTVAVGAGTKVIGFNLTNGAHIGTAHVTGGASPGISSIIVHQEQFVVSGTQALAVFGSDLTERFSISKQKTTTINSVGASSGYLYYTADDAEASGVDAYLVIVNLNTYAESRINNIMLASSSDANGKILVLQNNNPVLGYVSLSTGAFVWKNTKIATDFANVQAFQLLPTTDAAIVIGDNKVFSFDVQVGVEIFRYRSPFSTIANPTVAVGRLVFIGSTTGSPTVVAAVDLSTGALIGQVATPTLSVPAIAVSGTNAVMVNGQGFTRVNLLTMTAVAYNLNIPGANAVAAVRLADSPSWTTFVIAGLIQASAVVVADA